MGLYNYFVVRPGIYNESPSITIEITTKCNLRCSYCPKSTLQNEVIADMPKELFITTVNQALQMNPKPKEIWLVGLGEPLLYPDFSEAVAYIKNVGPAVKVTTVTNGTLLNGKNRDMLARSGIDIVVISLNATSREQYKAINNADLYDKTVENIIQFLDLVNSMDVDMIIHVRALEGPNSKEDLLAFEQEWRPRLGKRGRVAFEPLVNWAGMAPEDFCEANSKRTRNKYPCFQIEKRGLLITLDGSVFPCCMVGYDNCSPLVLGNVQMNTLQELRDGTKLRELKRMNAYGSLYDLPPCRKCNAYLATPNVWIKNPFASLNSKKWL